MPDHEAARRPPWMMPPVNDGGIRPDELTVDLEALAAFVDAVSDSAIREECRDIGADVGAP